MPSSSTNNDFSNYVHSNYIPGATASQVAQLSKLYPQDVTQGSPYNTGSAWALTPQFKRLASVQGDLVFQAPRRHFIQNTASKQKVWSFRMSKRHFLNSYHSPNLSVNQRLKATPILGTVRTISRVGLRPLTSSDSPFFLVPWF